jgi:hypothetical protein
MLMKLRSLFLTIAAGLIVSGMGALDAHAGPITLPAALDPGLVTTVFTSPALILASSNGNTATVNGVESLTFSDFSYTSTAQGTAVAYSPTAVGVTSYITNTETGISFNAGWSVSSTNGVAGILDIAITYTVTAPVGELLNDANLIISGNLTGSGSAGVGETLIGTPGTLGLTASLPTSLSDSVTFGGVQSITVHKDIILNSGLDGSASISIVTQGFSSTNVPEPSSVALLGIGMTGFLAFRRLFKRHAVA